MTVAIRRVIISYALLFLIAAPAASAQELRELKIIDSIGGKIHGIGMYEGRTVVAIGDRFETMETPLEPSGLASLGKQIPFRGFRTSFTEFGADRMYWIRAFRSINTSDRPFALTAHQLSDIAEGRFGGMQTHILIHIPTENPPIFRRTSENLYWWAHFNNVQKFLSDPRSTRPRMIHASGPLRTALNLGIGDNDLWVHESANVLATYSIGGNEISPRARVELDYELNDLHNDEAGRFILTASEEGLHFYDSDQTLMPQPETVLDAAIGKVDQVPGVGMGAEADGELMLIDVSGASPAYDFSVPDASLPAAREADVLTSGIPTGGVQWFDVASPAAPLLLGEYEFPNSIGAITPIGTGQIVVQTAPNRLGFISGWERGAPSMQWELELPGEMVGMSRIGERIALTINMAHASGSEFPPRAAIFTLNLEGQPDSGADELELESWDSSSAIAHFEMDDHSFAVLNAQGTLQLLHWFEGELRVSGDLEVGMIGSLAYEQDHLYVAGEETGVVQIYEITGPSIPRPVAELPMSSEVLDIQILNDLLLVARDGGQVSVFNLHLDPANPRLESVINFAGEIQDLAGRGNKMYVVEQFPENVWEIDLKNPQLPVISARAPERQLIGEVLAPSTELLYVSHRDNGVTALDIGKEDARPSSTPPSTPDDSRNASIFLPKLIQTLATDSA